MSHVAETVKFIGRRDEVTELAVILEKAVASEGQVVFISGEAGVGKTRFINEVCSLPIGQQFNWLTARCIYQEGTDPYLPFSDALKGWLGPPSTTKSKSPSTTTTTEQPSPKEYNLEELAKIPVLGPKLTEDPSMSFGSFMVKEPKSEFCLSIFSTLVAQDRRGLCITRIPPEKLGDLTNNDKVNTFWLSSRQGESCLPPSLTKLSHEITQFAGFHQNSVIILDGLEYLISHLEFNKVLRFTSELIDTMAVHKNILLIPINPLTMDPKQLALLERNMNTIDMSVCTETPEPVVTYETMESPDNQKFIEERLLQGRNIMFETTTQKIIDIATTKPVALFIDDLQWADEGALHLLHYLARAIRDKPVAIIGAYRPEDLVTTDKTHPLQALLDRLIPEKLLKVIKMDRLNELETGEMIHSFLLNTKFPKDLVEFIYKDTEGNPFFIDEIVRSLEEEKVIRYNENQASWTLTREIPEIGLPDTVKDALLARINRLPKDMRLILEIASILGVEFEYNILAMVAMQDEDQLVTCLDDLMRYNLLIEQPTKFCEPITYRFAHNKICEVLYKGLGQSHKRLLHSKAASAMEERYNYDLDSVLYELAQHCYYSGDHKRGLKYTSSITGP
jgi:archaellum biogenesis ATPase FlaH